MPSNIWRPRRIFSFSDWNKSNGREPPPGDRLDAQFDLIISAILSTQAALSDIRRDDGKLRNKSVGTDQLDLSLADDIASAIAQRTAPLFQRTDQLAILATRAEDNLSLYARDAEAAAISASQFLSASNTAQVLAERAQAIAINAANTADIDAVDAENWADYSKAQADNAIKAKDEALQWAEYLAGPVVDASEAPAYIADTPFPHGLYYQPVEGYGGVGGLWSAKWWAIYAAQLVGPWNFYYLGGFASPPLPGSTNPTTGVKVPTPIAPGSIYYDTTSKTIYAWDGTEWKSPYSLATGVSSRFVYTVAADGQTVFTGADDNGATPAVGTSPSDVHVNGVRYVANIDYAIDAASSTLTLTIGVPANTVVQWDLLVSPDLLVPGNIHAFKVMLTPAVPDGTATVFTMTYNHPVNGITPVDVTDGAQLQVSLEGIVQEPGADYSGTGNTLTFVEAPLAGSRLWVVWFSNAVLTS